MVQSPSAFSLKPQPGKRAALAEATRDRAELENAPQVSSHSSPVMRWLRP